jgi:DNA-binding GntR family transcriptional regulator
LKLVVPRLLIVLAPGAGASPYIMYGVMAADRIRFTRDVRANPLSVQIADALREAIVCGEYGHGEPLSQESVARRFSVSTMPAREALLALAREGMIEAQPSRAFRVARMAREDVEDIYWMHSVVAGRMAARACARLTRDAVANLEETNAKLGVAVGAGDLDEVRRRNAEFHEAIGVAADSPRLAAMMLTTVSQIPRHFYTRLHGWGPFSFEDHQRLLEAFRRRSPKRAEAIAAEHVATEGRLMLDYLDSHGLAKETRG